MNILAIAGSLGSGKSTLVANTVLQAVKEGVVALNRIAYLLNDRPTPDGRMVDGHNIRDIAKVIPFPNRCFTCEDSSFLVTKLHDLAKDGAVDLAIIEGYGFVAGAETHEVLAATGYTFHVFSLLDVRHLAQNIATYGRVIQSQINAATLGVGMTHITDEGAESAFEFVGEHVKAGVPAMEIKAGHGIPSQLFERCLPQKNVFLSKRYHCAQCHSGHDHPHHHDYPHHDHEHDHSHHEHAHDFFSVTYPLRADVTVKDLQMALGGLPILRAKGFAGGVRFDLVHGDWVNGDHVSAQLGIVTLYSNEMKIQIPEDFIDREVRHLVEGSTKALLRENGDLELTQAALMKLMSNIPSQAIVLKNPDGQYRVAVQIEELQILKQVAQRPNVKDEWLLPAIIKAIQYWIACARFIEVNEKNMDVAELPVSRQELGLSLGWWTDRFEKELGVELVSDVVGCKVGQLLAMGLSGNKSQGAMDPKRLQEQMKYHEIVMSFAKRHGEDIEALPVQQ